MANSAFNPVAKATGGNLFHSDETVSGSVNGSNTAFTTQNAYIAGTLEVYINGLRQARTTHVAETTPASGVFTLDTAPLTGDIVRVNYQTTVAQTNAADTVDSFHASSTPTANRLIPLDANAKFSSELLHNPYKFRAYNSSGFLLTNGSFGKTTFNVEVYDTNNNFASSTYTVPVTGFYHIQGRVSHGNAGNYRSLCSIYVNGSSAARGSDVTAPFAGSTASADLYLTAGDTVELFNLTTTAALTADTSGADCCWFAGHLISKT